MDEANMASSLQNRPRFGRSHSQVGLRNIAPLCHAHDGGYAATSGVTMDPGGDDSHLGSTGLNHSLTPIGLLREWALPMGVRTSDPDWPDGHPGHRQQSTGLKSINRLVLRSIA